MNEHPTTPPPRSGRKIAALVAAGVLALFSLGMFAAGGGLLYGESQKDDQGYLSTDTERFTTDTYALATQNLDVNMDGLTDVVQDDTLGKVRVKVTSNQDKPAFVGIARTSDVKYYLAGTSHAIVDDIDSSPFSADYHTIEGDSAPRSPASQRFWAASAHGAGTQTLTWDVKEGDWSVVVMNADGSAGVDAGISAGAMISWLDEAGWILAGGGALFLLIAGGLLFAGIRPGGPTPPAAPAAPIAPEPVPVTA
jgi:hypothetical protein